METTYQKTFPVNQLYNWGNEWFGISCSDAYMQKICTIFENYRNTNNKGVLYKLYLTEFKGEFKNISCREIFLGLLKLIIPEDDSSLARIVYAKIKIPRIKLPTRIIEFAFKENSKTTLILTMNNGWSISFRIHNASTKVEPSLKFDIQLKSKPEDIFYLNRKW